MNAINESQVVPCEASLLKAMLASDADALDQLLHDHLIFNGPTGETATKAQDLANYRAGGIHLHTVAASDMQMSSIGDDVIVAVSVRLAGNYMGTEVDGTFRYLRVWKFCDGRWQVIAGSVVGM